MADSAINPGIHWVHRFYREWRSQMFEAENGKDLFQQLEQEVSGADPGGGGGPGGPNPPFL